MNLEHVPTSDAIIEMTGLCYRLAVESIENGDLDGASRGLLEARSAYRVHFPFGQGNCLSRLGLIAQYTGKKKRALHFFKASYVFYQKYLDAGDHVVYQHGFASAAGQLGLFYLRTYRYQLARKALEESIGILEHLVATDPDDIAYQHDLAMTYENAGLLYQALRDRDRAGSYYAKLTAITQKLLDQDPNRLEFQILLIRGLKMKGFDELGREHYDEAETAFLQGLGLLEKLIIRQQRRIFFVVDACSFRMQLASVYRKNGHHAQSLQLYRETGTAYQEIIDQYPDDHGSRFNQAICFEQQGMILLQMNQDLPALEALQVFLSLVESLPGQPDVDIQLSLSIGHKVIGTLQRNLGNIAESLKHYQQMYRLADQLYQQHRHSPPVSYHFAIASIYAGQLNMDAGAFEAAALHFQESAKILESLLKAEPADLDYNDEYTFAMELLAVCIKRFPEPSRRSSSHPVFKLFFRVSAILGSFYRQLRNLAGQLRDI